MALANKQKEAIKKFVDLIAVASGGEFEFAIRTEPMAILFDRLLKVRPWSDMFDQWELTLLVRRLITKLGADHVFQWMKSAGVDLGLR